MKRNEIWKIIGKSPSGRKTYSISNFGRCKSLDNVTGCVNISRGNLNRHTGYYSFNGQYVHRLVAKYFLENPNPTLYTEVDHIRPDKKINRATNLRYVTVSQNRKRLHKKRAQSKNFHCEKHSKEIIKAVKFLENGEEIRFFENGCQAAKSIGCSHVLVYNAINKKGSARTAKGWNLSWEKKEGK